MTRIAKLYERALVGSALSFAELQRLAEAFGFRLRRISGSHHIYRHADAPATLNLQRVGKAAKPYQVRQFLDMVEEYSLQADPE